MLSHWQFVVSPLQLLWSFMLQSTALLLLMSWGVPHWQSLQSFVVNQWFAETDEGSPEDGVWYQSQSEVGTVTSF